MARPSRSPEDAAAAERRAGTRPYLRSDDRRRQLLETATRIAGREGVEQLTIVGLANAASVSRQLVYDHFSDRSSLVAAMIMHRFAAVDEAMGRIAGPEGPGDPMQTAHYAATRFLELSREDRHILRSLMSHTDAPEHELAPLATELRERSINRWLPIVHPAEGVGARARTWALVQALGALGELVSTEVLTTEHALAEFIALVQASLDGARAAQRSSNRAGTRRRGTGASAPTGDAA